MGQGITVSSKLLQADASKPVSVEPWGPLPLTPFEAMMIADDRPGTAMSCSAEFYFEGAIQRQPFERAMEIIKNRHRLIQAVVREHGKQLFWHPTEKNAPLYWNHPNAAKEQQELPPLDVAQLPGFRCWVNVEAVPGKVTDDGTALYRSILRYDFHHACCDAIGGMAYIEDLFTVYDALIQGKPPKLRPIDQSRLSNRSHITFPAKWSTKIYRTIVDLRKSFRLLLTRSLPIPTLRACQPWQSRFIVRHLPEEDLIGLRYAASDASASLNDFLLVEFLCLLRDWVQSDSGTEPRTSSVRSKDHIRVITPMNLRDRQDLKLEAANKIGFSFLSRSLEQLRDADTTRWSEFIAEVNSEIEQAKRLRLPAQFLKKLAIARIWPWCFKHCFSESRCWGTAVLTQLGDPTRRFYNRFPRIDGRILIGDLRLTDFVSCGPLRPMTHAILSTNAYGNELTLSMRCDASKIARKTAEEFLDDFVDRLHRRGEMHRTTETAATQPTQR